MSSDKVKKFFATGMLMFSIGSQSMPLWGVFNKAAVKETHHDAPSPCVPEPASAKNNYIYGTNCH